MKEKDVFDFVSCLGVVVVVVVVSHTYQCQVVYEKCVCEFCLFDDGVYRVSDFTLSPHSMCCNANSIPSDEFRRRTHTHMHTHTYTRGALKHRKIAHIF